MSLTVPWDPPKTVKPKRPGIDKEERCMPKLKQEADGQGYLFKIQERILS